jgi:hypothetical protein
MLCFFARSQWEKNLKSIPFKGVLSWKQCSCDVITGKVYWGTTWRHIEIHIFVFNLMWSRELLIESVQLTINFDIFVSLPGSTLLLLICARNFQCSAISKIISYFSDEHSLPSQLPLNLSYPDRHLLTLAQRYFPGRFWHSSFDLHALFLSHSLMSWFTRRKKVYDLLRLLYTSDITYQYFIVSFIHS